MNERSLRLIKPHCDGCGRVKVRDSEGKLRFVKKLANKQLPPIAKDTSQDLRSRLDSVVATELEDDI